MDYKKLSKEQLKECSEIIQEYKKCSQKQKLMITMNEKLLEKLDRLAEQEHKTRSGAISEAVDLWVQMMTQINMLKEKENEEN